MRVLVACEFSGVVREAFRKRGHDAWSCDILPTEISGKHIQADVLSILNEGWDLMIAHPPCTHLASSGALYFKQKRESGVQQQALAFVQALLDAPISKICLENPISVISTYIRKPNQIVQPWMFGHPETKATCLWLKNLTLLRPTDIVVGREPRIAKMCDKKGRAHERSRTYTGIAVAMAEQWG